MKRSFIATYWALDDKKGNDSLGLLALIGAGTLARKHIPTLNLDVGTSHKSRSNVQPAKQIE
jgi:hypothetical protein